MLTQILFGNYLTQTLTLDDSSGTDRAPRDRYMKKVWLIKMLHFYGHNY